MLFLDELAEFPRAVLDQLRQPLEEGTVRLSRARLKTAFPAAITLVAATNPCACGWHGDREHGCRCSQSQRQRYWQRLSGPLLDRLDLQLRLERRPAQEMRRCLQGDHRSDDPWLQPQTIAAARQRMQQRNPGGVCNRDLPARALGGSRWLCTGGPAVVGAPGGPSGALHPQWHPAAAGGADRGRPERRRCGQLRRGGGGQPLPLQRCDGVATISAAFSRELTEHR